MPLKNGLPMNSGVPMARLSMSSCML